MECNCRFPDGLCQALLHIACQTDNNLAMVKYLIEKVGCDLNVTEKELKSPLNIAAFYGNLDVVRYLIEDQNLNPRFQDTLGRTSLHYACLKDNSLLIVKYLVEEHGCNPSEKDNQKNSPLCVAASSGSLDILKYLIEGKACSTDLYDRTLLHVACESFANLAVVKYLIEERDCDPNAKDTEGNTPLNVAAFSGCLEILKYFIEDIESVTHNIQVLWVELFFMMPAKKLTTWPW